MSKIYKIDLISYSIWLEVSDRAHKIIRKVFTEVRTESFCGTGTTGITIKPSGRRQVYSRLALFVPPGSYSTSMFLTVCVFKCVASEFYQHKTPQKCCRGLQPEEGREHGLLLTRAAERLQITVSCWTHPGQRCHWRGSWFFHSILWQSVYSIIHWFK